MTIARFRLCPIARIVSTSNSTRNIICIVGLVKCKLPGALDGGALAPVMASRIQRDQHSGTNITQIAGLTSLWDISDAD